MRRILVLFLAALLVVSLDFTPAWADGADTGDPSVTGGKGSYVGRLDRLTSGGKRHANHNSRKPGGALSHHRKVTEKPRLTKTQWTAFLAMCRQTYSDAGCRETTAMPKRKPSTAKLIRSLSSVARTLIVRLQLPDPTPRLGPDPTKNEWKMAAVGFPLWLWTDRPTTIANRVRAYGVTFTLRATWQSTTFDMGDGHQVTCTHTSVYPTSTEPGRKSPDCGYTYLTSSLPKGNYRVTATTNWRISWTALGQSGSLPGSHTGTLTLPVGELNALVVR